MPGGPEDRNPPRLLHVTPDSNAVNVHDRNVVFTFDETINDRGAGAQELDNFFLVSPSDGNPRVSYLNLGDTVDLNDPQLSFDHMHLTATGNRRAAAGFVEPVLEMAARRAAERR